ncbi:MAG: protease B nonderepressible form [Pleopsidium flavum]|nr:MAG: protease B nonderepressible form [Pleopsidium flavum]
MVLRLRRDLLCPILRKVFGDRIKCQSPEVLCLDLDEIRIAAKVDFQETFSGLFLLSERFASSSSWQYHHLLPSLSDLIIYIEQNICSSTDQTCHSRASSLRAASYLDIDYDTISQVVVSSAFWPQPPNSDSWNERIQNLEGTHQVEVGVLASEKPTEPEELTLGGFLTVIGEDDKANPTLFSFPSRHHPLSNSSQGTYSSSFTSPTGLHPTLGLNFQTTSTNPPATTCALHAYLTLPSYLFADKYQLSDPLFLASKHLHSIRSISGETDLEAPDWAVKKWGSSMLVELSPPSPRKYQAQHERNWHADIPLHLRYLPPTAGGITKVQVPWPVVFWACTAEEGTKMTVNPFDRVNLGYDGLFGPRTMFYHLEPTPPGNVNGTLVETLDVPVLDMEKAEYVEVGTVLVVLVGFLWVCWKLVAVFRHVGIGGGTSEGQELKKRS